MATQTQHAQWSRPTQTPAPPADRNEPAPDEPPPAATHLRYLTPDVCTIHLGGHDALHVTVRDERIYGGVFAAYAFPVAHAEEFISLLYSGGDGDEREIGVIRNLAQFPPDQADLVRQALARRYFIHRIRRIHKIGWKHGLVHLDVETDKGAVEILMRWRHNKAVDYGRRGKVLIDLYNNRYLIPDLRRLTPREHREFRRIIYW